ncbi:hypothetical protein [Granulicoccus phenolivorans]|uniref:hypothetical protein n=1 Tax=Granulicoccus phenolivorans TaxID=266854 RepID=UPI000B0BB74A|nr:hypothetical protein [Granulicoccus phenolivorans]
MTQQPQQAGPPPLPGRQPEAAPPPLPNQYPSPAPAPDYAGPPAGNGAPPPLPRDQGYAAPPPLPQQPGPGAPPPLPVQDRMPAQNPMPEQNHMPAPAPMPSPDPLPDPGALPDPAALYVTESTRNYPCPNCGGQLVYPPGQDSLRCPNCGTTAPIAVDPGPVPKRGLGEAMHQLRALTALPETAQPTWEKEIVCQACGGHSTFGGTLTAIRCPYCNSPIQRDDLQAAPARLPLDGVLPFRVGEPEAHELIGKWINSRRFAPNAFKKYRELGSFSSIYLPWYAYDADCTTNYTGQRGEYYYVTVRDGDNERQEQRTRWYPAAGTVWNRFADVPSLASTGMDVGKISALEPWPMEQSVRYTPAFVAGHLSRTYDVDAEEAFQTSAKKTIESGIRQTVERDIGGDTQQVNSMNVTYNRLDFAQFLMPVWLLTVTYSNQPYQVFINGVTGEVQGHRPWSKIKIALAILGALIVIAVIVYFIARSR